MLFSNDTTTSEIYTLSLHDALPISWLRRLPTRFGWLAREYPCTARSLIPRWRNRWLSFSRRRRTAASTSARDRSEEHTSELQSPYDLVCRLLLEKKKKKKKSHTPNN